jgi:hypothetical protein
VVLFPTASATPRLLPVATTFAVDGVMVASLMLVMPARPRGCGSAVVVLPRPITVVMAVVAAALLRAASVGCG